jgi:hypothetical protein
METPEVQRKSVRQLIAQERRLMVAFATRHHAEHEGRRDDFCRKCRHEVVMEWARAEGLV